MKTITRLTRTLKYFDRQVWTLFVADIINVLGTSLVNTFLAIYMYTNMGISMTDVGIGFFVSAIIGAVASYIGGSLADSVGRKKILIAGLAMQVGVYLLFSYALDANFSFSYMVIVMAINALVGSLYRPIPEVMVADVVEPSKRVEAYGLLRIGANLGWVIGPVLGGSLLLFMPYSSVFYITALTTFIYLLIAVFLLRDTKPATVKQKLNLKDIKYILSDRVFLFFCILWALMLVPYQQMYTLLSVYSSSYVGLNEFWVGVIFAESGIIVVLTQFAVSAQVKKFRMTTALVVCCLIFAAGFGMLATSTIVVLPFIAVAVLTIAEMIWSPAAATLQANLAPEDRRGGYFGFSSLFTQVGYAIGPLFGGVLKDSMNNNVPSMWLVVGALFVVCSFGFLLLARIVPAKANGTPVKFWKKKTEAVIKVSDK
ncbi:putative permease (major facilitator superfamily) [Methanocella arvoryzae MRE50]|uniref:Permease (Major facilitator superfamily) n=2 Tax=Methanocella TaxID=570266 RepID=Q0W0F5_METAR|nr:putative permease (major facilitator superfamily) [Methanocella arvoryzae MRE50]